ncbi:methyl-accepting chemotaxis protein [Vibrio sp. JC009]|uniref:methyl-accepting chemotaxis protein n=1 Tax=Vibrio sp. JC009 TaxID=2912314 RepID=UPI0023B19536|nr:HAMP domain-containing methyl-accepting chemotaxis protein [Vibrio sp. JC009]WED23113.1 methyl-accepting chemotaxis protein [Vibrio sp. JC009]
MNLYSVNFRLRTIVLLVIASLSIIAYASISGMKEASRSIHHLYSQGLINSNRANEALNRIDTARSELLLAFQHDPDGKFVAMHDHPTSQHLDSVMSDLNEVKVLVSQEILASELTDEQKQLAEQLLKELTTLTNLGFKVSINEINKGNFNNANRVLLTTINPKYKVVSRLAREFLAAQVEAARQIYDETEAQINTFIFQLSIIALIAAGAISVLAWVIIRRIRRALKRIQTTAQIVSEGDLTRRVELDGNDELADVSHNVDVIVSEFQNVISNMDQFSVQLASAAEEGSAVSVQTKQNVVEQEQQTQMVATAIHEFSSTVQEVANSAASAAEASDAAERATDEGMQVVQNTIEMINKLNDEIVESTGTIEQLSKQSMEIGSVVDVIDGISEQTNLLALNAAIEAARAGEAGRGFAVVADEVRSLASRTQQSTEEIKAMIQSLQESSNSSLQRMEQGAEQARMTVEMANEAGTALNRISDNVERINSMNAQIATAAEQQSSVTDEINQNVVSISDISSQTSAGAEQSSSTSLEVARLTETMRDSVTKFNY